jgi:hypothetical protein
MRVFLVLPLIVACAHAGSARPVSDLRTQYEVAVTIPDVEAPLPPEYSGSLPPCVVKSSTSSTGNACREDDISTGEATAFQREATRLASHTDENCRRLGDAIQNHLSGIRMYDRAIVRRSGRYKFYGVGHSYQSNGEWMIRIARRLDDLNARTLDAITRTLRHEVSHTLGAREISGGDAWSARDYAERCG